MSYLNILPYDIINLLISYLDVDTLYNFIEIIPYPINWSFVYNHRTGIWRKDVTLKLYINHVEREILMIWLNDVHANINFSIPLHHSTPKDPSEYIIYLEYVTTLVINHRGLSSLPKEIRVLENLAGLDLIANNFTTIPKEIFCLNNLREILIHHTPITELPNELFKMKHLKYGGIRGIKDTKIKRVPYILKEYIDYLW